MNEKLNPGESQAIEMDLHTPLDRVNIESLMLMAKYDIQFRNKLFINREKALNESGIDFSSGERKLLSKISNENMKKNIDEFYIPGINEKSLPNWRKTASVALLVTSMMMTGFHCSNNDVVRGITTTQGYSSESQWIDNDTFMITAIGAPNRNIEDIEKRKKSAFHAAVLNAQYQTTHTFIRSPVEKKSGAVSDEDRNESNKNIRILKNIIKNGTIENIRWKKDQICEIDFQVQHKGLKKFVSIEPLQ